MLSERPLKSADQKTERSKILNPEYNMDRDQPTSRASPLRINTLLFGGLGTLILTEIMPVHAHEKSFGDEFSESLLLAMYIVIFVKNLY